MRPHQGRTTIKTGNHSTPDKKASQVKTKIQIRTLLCLLGLILLPTASPAQQAIQESGGVKNQIAKADPDVVIDGSIYRIGVSNDGNDHDSDDLLDVALEIALCAEAGLKNKLTHVDYSNHLGHSKPGRVENMRANAIGAAERWGVSKDILFDCQEDLAGAINSISHQINISTADDRFFYNCTGPMEVPYRGIMAADPEKRKFAYAISHSVWNDEHAHGEHLTHTWEDIQKTGINCIHIKNQDKHGGMKSPIRDWDWLTKADNPDWQWLWTIATRDGKTKFDGSGTGVVWYIITGRGDELGNGAKFQKVFSGKFKTNQEGSQ